MGGTLRGLVSRWLELLYPERRGGFLWGHKRSNKVGYPNIIVSYLVYERRFSIGSIYIPTVYHSICSDFPSGWVHRFHGMVWVIDSQILPFWSDPFPNPSVHSCAFSPLNSIYFLLDLHGHTYELERCRPPWEQSPVLWFLFAIQNIVKILRISEILNQWFVFFFVYLNSFSLLYIPPNL